MCIEITVNPANVYEYYSYNNSIIIFHRQKRKQIVCGDVVLSNK